MMRVSGQRAFTMIEVIVVIVIIAVLAGLLLPAVHYARVHSLVSGTKAELKALTQALAEFEETFGAPVPRRLPRGPAIIEPLSGGDGVCNSTAAPDDIQVVANGAAAGRGAILILSGPDGILQTGVGGDDAIQPRPSIIADGGDGSRDGGTTLSNDDTWMDGSAGAWPDPWAGTLGADGVPPGVILVLPGPDGVLDSSPGGDEQVLHRSFFTNVDPANAVPPGGGAAVLGAADLNGTAAANGDLDEAECLYYFLGMTWRVNPQPASRFTAASFESGEYFRDPTRFEFIPAAWMKQVDHDAFYDVGGLQARDTDGDGYLELCDLFGSPLRYVRRVPGVIVEPRVGGNAWADTDAAAGDVQIIPGPTPGPAGAATAGQIVVHPGLDWVLDTTPDVDTTNPFDETEEVDTSWFKSNVGLIYSVGPNEIDNAAFDDKTLGNEKSDDDGNGIEDDEDDINNL